MKRSGRAGVWRIWIGLLLLLIVGGGSWWACARERGPETRTIRLSVLAQKLYGAGSGGRIPVRQGDTVTLSITTDEAMEVFLHKYDIEAKVKPGAPGILQFAANIPGNHPLMIHALGEDEGSHKKVEILLGYVEVQPRR